MHPGTLDVVYLSLNNTNIITLSRFSQLFPCKATHIVLAAEVKNTKFNLCNIIKTTYNGTEPNSVPTFYTYLTIQFTQHAVLL